MYMFLTYLHLTRTPLHSVDEQPLHLADSRVLLAQSSPAVTRGRAGADRVEFADIGRWCHVLVSQVGDESRTADDCGTHADNMETRARFTIARWDRVMLFFFQAEDGIRDLTVTGVQTCALPIWCCWRSAARRCSAASAPAGRSRPCN